MAASRLAMSSSISLLIDTRPPRAPRPQDAARRRAWDRARFGLSAHLLKRPEGVVSSPPSPVGLGLKRAELRAESSGVAAVVYPMVDLPVRAPALRLRPICFDMIALASTPRTGPTLRHSPSAR